MIVGVIVLIFKKGAEVKGKRYCFNTKNDNFQSRRDRLLGVGTSTFWFHHSFVIPHSDFVIIINN
jgi:hypothetical protein